jgi:Na+/H+-translocating membrane pyrophosphatase
LLLEIGSFIERGAKAFLFAEYKYIAIFSVALSILIFLTVEPELGTFWTTIAFLLGALTSILSGYIGMRVAVYSNFRCAYEA